MTSKILKFNGRFYQKAHIVSAWVHGNEVLIRDISGVVDRFELADEQAARYRLELLEHDLDS